MATLADHVFRVALRASGFDTGHLSTSAGRTHFVRARGKGGGPRVVFIHGFGASASQLAPILRAVTEVSREVVAFDLPNHGFSESSRGAPSPATMEEPVMESLRALIPKPSVVVGNSMGGYVAIRWALAHPELTQRLVLISPGGASMTREELDEFRKVFDINSHKDAIEFLDRLFASPHPLRRLFALGVPRNLGRPALRALMAAVAPEDLLVPEEIGALQPPVELIWGKQDGILPRENLAFFLEHLPASARVHEVEGFGHSPYLDTPKRLAQLLSDILREASADNQR